MKKTIFILASCLLLIMGACNSYDETYKSSIEASIRESILAEQTSKEVTTAPTKTKPTEPSTTKSVEKDKGVKYLTGEEAWFSDENNEFIILFSLQDEEDNKLAAACHVDVSIVDDSGIELYKGSHDLTEDDFSMWGKPDEEYELFGSIQIEESELKKATSAFGTAYLNVKGKNFSFKEISLRTKWLPMADIKLDLPELPFEYVNYDYDETIETKCLVTDIHYGFDDSFVPQFKIYFTGEKTYDYQGENGTNNIMIRWKLYEEDIVIDSGSVYIDNLIVGDKFANENDYSLKVEPGKEYKLVIYN